MVAFKLLYGMRHGGQTARGRAAIVGSLTQVVPFANCPEGAEAISPRATSLGPDVHAQLSPEWARKYRVEQMALTCFVIAISG